MPSGTVSDQRERGDGTPSAVRQTEIELARRLRPSLAPSLAVLCTVALSCSPVRAEGTPRRTVLFSSLEAGHSAFSTSGAKVAVDRFERDGFVALVSAGSGVRLEGNGRLPVLARTTALGAALGGYQFVRSWGVATLLAGPELAYELLAGWDGARPMPLRSGLRLHGEVWARPTETTLATASVILGSARGDAWLRLSWGLSLFGAYLGPEAVGAVDRTGYRKWGLGLHATDIALGPSRFRLSAGCQFEGAAHAPLRPGPYVALAIWNPL